MEEMLKIENVSLTYYGKSSETQAISELSFTVEKGEFIAVIDPSGCGKTTLLSLLSDILKPISGNIFFNSKRVTGTSKDVGYMLQHDQLFDWRTIHKNLSLRLEAQKKSNKETLEHVEN